MGDEKHIDHAELGEMGKRLSALRHELGFRQSDFSKALGVSLRTYHYYEKGQTQCSVGSMWVLYETFGVDLNWFVSGVEWIEETTDAQQLSEFESRLDEYIAEAALRLTAEKRRAVIALWYQSRFTRRKEFQGDAGFWLKLVGGYAKDLTHGAHALKRASL